LTAVWLVASQLDPAMSLVNLAMPDLIVAKLVLDMPDTCLRLSLS
jgi:hypothetical protein